MSSHQEVIRQKPSPIPLLTTDRFNESQWEVLNALADTFIPVVSSDKADALRQKQYSANEYDAAYARLSTIAKPGANDSIVADYLAESATSQTEFRTQLARFMNLYLTSDDQRNFSLVLSALNTRIGMLALTRHVTPMPQLPIETRAKILLSWSTSRLPILRYLFKSLAILVKLIWLRTSPTLTKVLSYPRTPVHHPEPQFVFPFEFITIPRSASASTPQVFDADVVVVGSGCGGAVAAKTLAEAGLKVIVVEKSWYWKPEHLPMSEDEGTYHLFGNGGVYQSDDQSMAILAGSAWGGGGTVNWSACLQTQGFVRREWSHKFGLTHFTSGEFQADLDAVCERMGASVHAVEHNKSNRVLLEGARKLGWAAKPVAQNTGGETHYCGYCTLGCGSCGKKGPTETFLPDAAKAGAKFMEGFEVKEVLFSSERSGNDRVVSGIRGTWTSRDSSGGVAGADREQREVIIRAPRVVVAAGPIITPGILQKSGIKNHHLGKHLHLHPVGIVAAVWDEEVRPWEGGILTSVVNEVENQDGDGYGAKLESCTMIPSYFLSGFAWSGGLEWKEFTAKMRNMTGYISLARDRYGGTVYTDRTGRQRIAYSPSDHDRAHIVEGIARLAEILYVEGAREIYAPTPGLPPFVRNGNSSVTPPPSDVNDLERLPSVDDADFQRWIAALRKAGLPSPETQFASAHQMGTARMGRSARHGVVDAKGRVWGTKGLYVADTSVFPSASGVNPMITVMGISRGTARGIVDECKLVSTTSPVQAKL